MATQMLDLEGLNRPPPVRPEVYVSRIRGVQGSAVCRGLGLKVVIEGQETYRLDDRVRVVGRGEFIVVSPGQSFEVGVSCGREAVGLCIDLPVASVLGREGSDATGSPVPDAVFRLDDESLGRSVRTVWRDHGRVSSLAPELERWLLGHAFALGRLSARRASTRRELYARVERARQYLADHRDRRVSLRELETTAHLSAPHLNRVFRQVHGIPPMRYHQRLRLTEAADILSRGQMNPTALAEHLGYADLPTFTRAFRRVHGVPPSACGASKGPRSTNQ